MSLNCFRYFLVELSMIPSLGIISLQTFVRIFSVSLVLLTVSGCACSNSSNSQEHKKYTQQLIGVERPAMIDGIAIGEGRNDGVLRLYSTREWGTVTAGYEYSFTNGKWIASTVFNANAYCSSPVTADLKKQGKNLLYLGGWDDMGVLMLQHNNGWQKPDILTDSEGKGIVLAMKTGDGHNDGVSRLYVGHWSESGLIEYSWNNETYISNQIMNKSVGRFDIGQGRNDGINRLYAVERNGRDLHEFTWNGNSYSDEVIFSGSHISNGAVSVADGRGDGKNRIYVWAGGLFELTFENGQWRSLTLEKNNLERYYITIGTIRSDKKPGVYVSVKNRGVYEYSWSQESNKFGVDVITSATGGTAIGDIRGDGKNRLYAARGTKEHFTSASVVEIFEAK